jgi:dihydroflavonol-4-reductase
MEGMDAVIHAAAIVSFAGRDKKNMYQVNVDGTANVVNMALEKGLAKMIHISSVAALGRLATGGHVNEEKKWEESNVNTDYAKTKHKAELEVYRGIGEGLEAVILNPSTIIGFGDWQGSSCAIFRKVYKGFHWYTSGLNGFVDVGDVARAAVILLEKSINGERFIVNGDNWPFRQLQDTIADGFNVKKPSSQASRFILGVAWRMEAIKSLFTNERPLITKQSVKVAVSETRFDNKKLLRQLPEFSFTPLEISIKKACEKYLEVSK